MQFLLMMASISWQPSLYPNFVSSSFSFRRPSAVISSSTVFPTVLARSRAILLSLSLKMASSRTVSPAWQTLRSAPLVSLTLPRRMMQKQWSSSPILQRREEVASRGRPILSRQMLTMRWLRFAKGLNTSSASTAPSRLSSVRCFIAFGIARMAPRNRSLACSMRPASISELSLWRWDSICVVLVALRERSAASVLMRLSWEKLSLRGLMRTLGSFSLDWSCRQEGSLLAAFFSYVNDSSSKIVRYLRAGVCAASSVVLSIVSICGALSFSQPLTDS